MDHSLLDRETRDTHFLTVEAEDGDGLTSSVQLKILLADVNDNAPAIQRSRYYGYITENHMTLERPVIIQVGVK